MRQVLTKVALGEADAGIVYKTDALTMPDKVQIIEIPSQINVVAEYPIAALKAAPHPDLARAFVKLVLSKEGQRDLGRGGLHQGRATRSEVKPAVLSRATKSSTCTARPWWDWAACLLLFLVLPFVALVLDGGPEAIWRGLGCSLTWPALRLSLGTTLISVVLVVVGGTPLAWWLARSRWRSARWLEILLQLPVVIPPAVGGIALLLAFGRRGLFGGALERLGWTPAFSVVAVIMAQVFVSAPFYLQAAVQAFGRLDPNLLAVARSLGASPPRLLLSGGLAARAPLADRWGRHELGARTGGIWCHLDVRGEHDGKDADPAARHLHRIGTRHSHRAGPVALVGGVRLCALALSPALQSRG